ncbi:hypothetical protein ACFPYN_05495 [Paenisporosarcina macmurdoensis]|uniref:Uncharacterized protein n=1 Tax=Paenisporosarcina macmurdoensis TaxID=212659 RepID=A0ABW1L4L8_9BACL
MKKATMEILAKCPNLRFYVESKETQHDLKSLNKNEQVLVALARFFEYEESFDLNQLFKEVDSDWIEFAMDRLLTYFYSDTYLTKSPKPLIIKHPNDLLSQKDFGDLMNEHGGNMDTKKIHMLRKRGKLPTETALIGGKPYWLKEQIETYIHHLPIKNRDTD